MKRQHQLCMIAAAAAVWVGSTRPVASALGRVEIDGIAVGNRVDPFLDSAEALVRAGGFKGDFAALVGLSGLADEATMCRQDCDCRETRHSAEHLKTLLAPLSGTVTPFHPGAASPEELWDTIEAELRSGRPVMAEGLTGATSLGLIVGCDPQKKTLTITDGGRRLQKSFADWVQGDWAFSVAHIGTTHLPGPTAAVDALTRTFVEARQPRIEGSCAVRDDRTQNAVGLEAYSLWSERVLKEPSPDADAKGRRLRAWVERRRLLVKFLRGSAKHQDRETAARMNSAADDVQRELSQGLLPLAATVPHPAPAAVKNRQRDPKLRKQQAGLMRIAASCQQQFLSKIQPIAFRRLRLSPKAQALAAMKAPSGRGNTATLHAMLRARDSRIRTLGAIATARSGDASLADDLAADLHSKDPVEARASLAALKAVQPNDLVGLLRQELDAMRAAGGKVGSLPANKDSIQRQVQYAIEDIEGRRSGGLAGILRRFIHSMTHGPARFVLLAFLVAGLAIAGWRLFGPKRLAKKVGAPGWRLEDELPAEALRLEALLARPPATGLLITHLARGEMAEKQGLQSGDIIYRYNGQPIESLDELRQEAFKPGTPEREVAARRGLRTVKTVVASGPLGLGGVPVTRRETFWKRLDTFPYAADYSRLEGDGECWHRLSRAGEPCGFEWRRWQWVHGDLELQCVTWLAGEEGEESVRARQRLAAGDRLTCISTKFDARGSRTVETDATASGGQWIVEINGQSVPCNARANALPSHALVFLVATLPLEAGRAYNVVRVDEYEFAPSYGCQVVCMGSETIRAGERTEQAWRFELSEYGLRQMTFWLNNQRELLRTDYAGLLSTRSTREACLADVPQSAHALVKDAWRARYQEAAPASTPDADSSQVVGTGAEE